MSGRRSVEPCSIGSVGSLAHSESDAPIDVTLHYRLEPLVDIV